MKIRTVIKRIGVAISIVCVIIAVSVPILFYLVIRSWMNAPHPSDRHPLPAPSMNVEVYTICADFILYNETLL